MAEESTTPEPVAFTVGFTSIGISSTPLLAAIDVLVEQGYEIDTPELAESELVAEGVAQNQFQFGSGANNGTLLAIEQGAPIKWIIDRTQNEWQVYAVEGIETCEQLVNSRVAIHSPGSVSGAMLRDWVANNCPDETYEPLIIEGSQNRLAALLADQIDASPVEFGDALILDEEGGFARVVSFAQDLPGLHPTSVYGNTDWMADNPEATQALVTALLDQFRRINSEDGYLMELYERYLPEEAAGDNAQAIVDAYIEAGIFPDDGGLTDEAVEYTIGFFGPDGTGDVETVLDPADVADLSYLEAALDELGN
jgi:ABC-type nitrate/sulfonate/bicarbonate transport system substrate-binding protein